MTDWFRRPDGVLVAAQHPDVHDLFAQRGYTPVPEDDAVAEVESGTQAAMNAARVAADTDLREREVARERQQKAQQRRAEAHRVVEDAKLHTAAPKPPEADPEAVRRALAEAGPETRRR